MDWTKAIIAGLRQAQIKHLSSMASVTTYDLETAKAAQVHVSFGGMVGFLGSPDGIIVHLYALPKGGGKPVEFPIRFENHGPGATRLLVDLGFGQVGEALTMFL